MTDVRGARIVRLLEDPAVTGDLLLAGLALAAAYDFGWQHRSFAKIGPLLWSGTDPTWRLRRALSGDARTYRPPGWGARCCTAPMIRRSGTCGQPASANGYITDWDTGELVHCGACSRHQDWWWRTRAANRAARPDVPPLPYANHGGALRAHFPRLDWPRLWRRLDSRWVEHPEGQAWPKPDLTVIFGDDEGGGAVPLLSVVPAGAP